MFFPNVPRNTFSQFVQGLASGGAFGKERLVDVVRGETPLTPDDNLSAHLMPADDRAGPQAKPSSNVGGD